MSDANTHDVHPELPPQPTGLPPKPLSFISSQQNHESSLSPLKKRNTLVHGKRYSKVEKLAVAALVKTGKTPMEIQRETGVNRSTVLNIIHDPKFRIIPRKEVELIKDSLLGSSYSNALRAQNAITDEKLANSSALQLMTVAAIGIDKGRLMEGLSTENVSFKSTLHKLESDRVSLADKMNSIEIQGH